jgi:hypothetical protein
MKNKDVLGGVLASIAAVLGVIGHFVLFLDWYQVGMNTQSAEPGCEILLKYIHPLMADVGILAGILFAVSAYGYFTRKHWAFLVTQVALVMALLASWFINVPYLAAGLPPVYFSLFWPYLLLYVLFLRLVGKISWSQTLLSVLTGVAYIFCWMNGVASTSRMITIGAPIFTLVQRLHWVAMIGWAVVTVGIVMKSKEWMRVVGIAAATTELVVGIPLTIATAEQLGRFSLFALGPIASLVLLIVLMWPGLWQRWTRMEAE